MSKYEGVVKNTKRRLYDAINVMMAAKVISRRSSGVVKLEASLIEDVNRKTERQANMTKHVDILKNEDAFFKMIDGL